MSSLLDIVLDELDIEAGLWGRASLAIEALGEAVLAGTLLPSADNGAGLTFSTCYDTAFGYGAGVHFLANMGFSHPQRLFTRLTGEVSDQLLALVTPSEPDQADAVSVALGALHTLLPVAVRGLQARRLGHEVPGMRGVYTHVSEAMRTELKEALQARWEASLVARAAISAHSPVPLLDELLTRCRETQPKMISQIPPISAEDPTPAAGVGST
jgi:hypothetical protein